MNRSISVSATLALLTITPLASGQDTVDVNEGKTLTGDDLLAGFFCDQNFVLSENLTIEINNGGTLAQVGFDLPFPEPFVPFNFEGATINANAGGLIRSTIFENSFLSNTVINLHIGGRTGSDVLTSTDVTLNILGGSLGSFSNIQTGTTVNMKLGTFNTFQIGSGVVFDMSGGFASQGLRGDNSFTVSGGCVAPSILNSGAQLDLFVRSISVNGIDTPLSEGESIEITPSPDLVIEAVLANGQPYIFDALSGRDSLSLNISITATGMTTCGTDWNFDGSSDFTDLLVYLNAFTSTPAAGEFDCITEGGAYNSFSDVLAFLDAFVTGCD